MSEEFNYAKVLKTLGSSRFTLEMLDGEEVEATLRGQLMRSKKKTDKIEIYDWVKIQKTEMSIRGSFYKIIERIGSDRDSEVKKLKKTGVLNKIENKNLEKEHIEDTQIDRIVYDNLNKNKNDLPVLDENNDSWIDEL